MSLFPDTQTLISFGSIRFTWYAVIILTGVLIGYYLCQKTVQKWGYPKELLEDFLLPMMFIGILGARLYYVAFEWSYYSQHPSEIFAVWNGGLAIYGGILAGAIFAYFYFKHKKVSFLRMVDCIVPSLMLAQAFGRWGNFMNQEAFGKIVPESFYDGFPAFIKNQMFINGQFREPTFLYESTVNLLGFLFIYFIFRKYFYKKRGDCGFMYMIWYGLSRFVIEGMRTDSLMIGGLRVSQIVSLVLIGIGVLGLAGVFHKLLNLHNKPVVLFDLDGTLIDSQPLIFETFKRVFKEEKPDYELSQEELYSFFGPSLEESFSRHFESDQIDRLIQRYQEINVELHDSIVKPMPHVIEMLESLKEMNIPMAIVSNKRIAVVKMGMKACGLAPYFDVVLGKEDLPIPKPSASGLIEACHLLHTGHDDVIYVGDNASDIKAAKNMAAYSVGCSNDETQVEAMKQEHPSLIIHDLMDVVSLCKEEKTWSDNTIW